MCFNSQSTAVVTVAIPAILKWRLGGSLSAQPEAVFGQHLETTPQPTIDQHDRAGHHQGAAGQEGVLLFFSGAVDNCSESKRAAHRSEEHTSELQSLRH